MSETKLTAKQRYAQYFWEELKAHPRDPPSRTVIARRMGWKTPNHSGEMPQVRRDLLTQAGFILVNGRWRLFGLPKDRTPDSIERWLAS